jgi:hypothetical protein
MTRATAVVFHLLALAWLVGVIFGKGKRNGNNVWRGVPAGHLGVGRPGDCAYSPWSDSGASGRLHVP